MKTETHPDYVTASVRCSCGNTFTTRSVKPELRVELCNECLCLLGICLTVL